MSRISKNDDFHIPFIKHLAIMGLVTIVSMIMTQFFLSNYLPNLIQHSQYTIQQSQIQPE